MAFVIKRLLIANRGEIAVRIIRACREMGIESVAIYSDADRQALHVTEADRAVAVGPAPASESYLSIPAIIDAARSAGADAVHPGYGFLSENAAFSAACEEARLIFVGPTADTIARMGSKIDARRLMQQAGVPIVPGETPVDQSDEGLRAAIERVGLPSLVKPSHGGGGKGMRRIYERSEIAEAVPAARREAHAAFGRDTLYVERLIERPRHIEVQIFGDTHGRVTHVFERECSMQRRHQKIIEETPSPVVTPELRARITSAAVAAARAVSYRNAGTIEFLVDGDLFYFLEMNTRLQVEHPVTELVAGVDLVRTQLLVAAGERLPWADGGLTQRGHAIEARVYAEDPSKQFLPQAGRLSLYREPHMPGVRVDAGVAEGDTISVHYDPLIAKVIAWAESRTLALNRLITALRHFPILGVTTNVPFLIRIIEHADFREARCDTGFLDREIGALTERSGAVPDFVRAAMAATASGFARRTPSWDPWAPDQSVGPSFSSGVSTTGVITGASPDLKVGPTQTVATPRVYVAGPPSNRWAFWNGEVYRTTDESTASQRTGRGDGAQPLTAPMPATVIKVLTQNGATVRKGETVIILEAMKMELPLRASGDGTVSAIRCREGELVQPDRVLVEFE